MYLVISIKQFIAGDLGTWSVRDFSVLGIFFSHGKEKNLIRQDILIKSY